MGTVFGKIPVETPKYEVLKSTKDYVIRKYPSLVVAQVSYHPNEMKNNDKDGGFSILGDYIGALGNPQNTKVEKISMTAPVVTQTGEKISMTAPVMTQVGGGEDKAKDYVTMQFILPGKYSKVEDAPKPVDERVVIKEEGEKVYGMVTFSGVANDQVVNDKVDKLRKVLVNDGYKIVGPYLLARYNPPWTLPMFRTNEIMLPVVQGES